MSITTIVLVSDHDCTEYIGKLHVTSEDAAHFFMTAELPDQPYCIDGEEQTMFKLTPYVIDESYILRD